MANTRDSKANDLLVRQFEACNDFSDDFEALLEALCQAVEKGADTKIMAILGALLQERPYLTQFLQRFGPRPSLDSPGLALAWEQAKSQYIVEQATQVQADGRHFGRELAISVALTNHIDLWPLLMEGQAAKSPAPGQGQPNDPERHAELVLQKARRTKAEELYQKGRQEMLVGGLMDAALRYLTDAIEADPTHADAYDARSNVYISLDCIDEGMADMKRANELAAKSGVSLRDNAIG